VINPKVSTFVHVVSTSTQYSIITTTTKKKNYTELIKCIANAYTCWCLHCWFSNKM